MNARELADALSNLTCTSEEVIKERNLIIRALRELAEREEEKGETPETDSNLAFGFPEHVLADFARSLERRLREAELTILACKNPPKGRIYGDEEAIKDLVGRAERAEAELARARAVTFNPDWSELEAARDSLREHMAIVKALQRELVNQARDLTQASERESARAERAEAELAKLKAHAEAMHKEMTTFRNAIDPAPPHVESVNRWWASAEAYRRDFPKG
jgi:DNA repair exonuclease SbcCD ATPase subunit